MSYFSATVTFAIAFTFTSITSNSSTILSQLSLFSHKNNMRKLFIAKLSLVQTLLFLVGLTSGSNVSVEIYPHNPMLYKEPV